jgi:hypothetical protein
MDASFDVSHIMNIVTSSSLNIYVDTACVGYQGKSQRQYCKHIRALQIISISVIILGYQDNKEMGVKENGSETPEVQGQGSQPTNLGDEILNMLGERCQNPGEAFVILQQLCIYVWDQYKIDWSVSEGHSVADTRKQRYLDYVTQLIDTLKANHALAQETD